MGYWSILHLRQQRTAYGGKMKYLVIVGALLLLASACGSSSMEECKSTDDCKLQEQCMFVTCNDTKKYCVTLCEGDEQCLNISLHCFTGDCGSDSIECYWNKETACTNGTILAPAYCKYKDDTPGTTSRN